MQFLNLVTVFQLIYSVYSIAPVSSDSPTNFKAVSTFDSQIQGTVLFQSTNNGSVQVDLNLSGFDVKDGPYNYYIHENPIPGSVSSKSCLKTGSILNPYNGTTTGDASEIKIGDLSAKWGEISAYSAFQTFVDPYLSLNPSSEEYVGDRSIVIYFHNGTELTCANLTLVDEANSGNNYTITSKSNSSEPSSSAVSTHSHNSANTFQAGGFLGFVAFLLCLFA